MAHPLTLARNQGGPSFAFFAKGGAFPFERVGILKLSFLLQGAAPPKSGDMPTGLRRYYGDDHLHFLTCSCYHRQRCLGSATGRDLFLRIFEQARQRYRFVVVGYVVMPDHIHLLISEPERARPRRSCGGETTVCAASAAQEEVKTASFRKVREGWATRL